MVKTKWATISLPIDMLNKLDAFVLTDESKKHGYTSKSQIVSLLIRKFLNNELNVFDDKPKNEIQNMQKIKDGIKKMMKKLEIEKNTVENMTNLLNKSILGENNEIDDLKIDNIKINHSKNGELFINDSSLKKIIKITRKDEMPFCTYHNANFCYHISFISFNMMRFAMQKIKEDYDE